MRAPLFRLLAASIVLAALGFVSQAAGARPAFHADDDDWLIAPEGVQPGLRTADGGACVKQCPNDTTPCDPPAYKHADGRCTTAWH